MISADYAQADAEQSRTARLLTFRWRSILYFGGRNCVVPLFLFDSLKAKIVRVLSRREKATVSFSFRDIVRLLRVNREDTCIIHDTEHGIVPDPSMLTELANVMFFDSCFSSALFLYLLVGTRPRHDRFKFTIRKVSAEWVGGHGGRGI